MKNGIIDPGEMVEITELKTIPQLINALQMAVDSEHDLNIYFDEEMPILLENLRKTQVK